MLGALFIAAGAALMVLAALMLGGWVSGRAGRIGRAVLDRPGNSKADRQLLGLYFVALVLTPLLGGAILIAFGLRCLR